MSYRKQGPVSYWGYEKDFFSRLWGDLQSFIRRHLILECLLVFGFAAGNAFQAHQSNGAVLNVFENGLIGSIYGIGFALSFTLLYLFLRTGYTIWAEQRTRIAQLEARQSDAESLDSLADDLIVFLTDWLHHRIKSDRDLSFVGQHQRENPSIKVEHDSMVITDENDDAAMMRLEDIQDRHQYDVQKFADLLKRYAGRIQRAIELAAPVVPEIMERGDHSDEEAHSIHHLLKNGPEYYYPDSESWFRFVNNLKAAAEIIRNSP